MKAYVFLITILVVSCGTKNEKCQKLHTGKFTFISARGTKTYITRNDSIQTEYSKTGKTITKVRWIDDCTYELYDPVNGITNKPIPVAIIVRGEIYDITDSSYYVRLTNNALNNEMTLKMKISN